MPPKLRIENVRRLCGENLKFIVNWLSKQGYHAAVFPRVDPARLGLPARRVRVYLCAALIGSEAKTQFAVEAPIVYQSLQGPALSLASVDDYLKGSSLRPGPEPRPSKRQKRCKWESDFLRQLVARPLSLERSSALEVSQERFVGEQLLSERELAVLKIAVDSKSGVRFVDVSQSGGRAPSGENIVPCITPGGKLFDIERGCFLSGREKLHLQGIFPSQPADPELDDLEMDLAGNAFCAPAFFAVFMSALVALAPA
jgi:hypothetical protein